jgi:hypothetical protein
VQGFIDAAASASQATASGARQLPNVVGIAFVVLVCSYFILRFEFGPDEVMAKLNPIIYVTGFGVVVVFLNRYFSQSLYRLIERVRVERSYRYQKRQLADFEHRSERLDLFVDAPEYNTDLDDRVESERRYIQRRLGVINDRLRVLSHSRTELGAISDLAAGSRAATFRVFVATTIVLFSLVYVAWSNLFPIAANLFYLPIEDALRTIILLIPMLLFIFVFLQTWVPAGQILASGNSPEAGGSDDPLHQSSIFLFLLGISLSLALTFSALALGHLLAPDAPLPQTIQLVVSNAIFDGLTLMLTIRVLQFATQNVVRARDLSSQTLLSLKVGIAIVVDLIIAAVLAIFSLYIGLFGTELELGFVETLNVLRGLSPAGTGLEFGPFFWVMHTAFIPTAIYLCLLVLMIFMKIIAVLFIDLLRGRLGAGIPATGTILVTLAGLTGYLIFIAQEHQLFGS